GYMDLLISKATISGFPRSSSGSHACTNPAISIVCQRITIQGTYCFPGSLKRHTAMRRKSAAMTLAERFCRPHRIGLFGHRGVGKTTLLTVLYREAVSGRLPELRLAAADVATAEYLSGKVTQLESGQALPATLAETDLGFHLYHQQARLEL